MRITGGQWSGRVLEVPKGPAIRPTQDQVRAALFNILGDRVVGARVLDLFAGSGAMGIEALSRGAAHVTFVDSSPFCVRAIRENLGKLVAPPIFRVMRADTVAAIRKLAQEGAVFDLVILDPPYGGESAIKSLNALSQHAIVGLSGWVIAEHDKRDSLPVKIDGEVRRFVSQRIERYGDTALTFFA